MPAETIGNGSTLARASHVLLACLQNMTMGGVFFGWSSISVTLLLSHEGGPGLSIAEVQDIYVASTFASSMGPLFLGIVLDSYGPRVCSLVSVFLILIGFILFSYSDEKTLNFFSLAMCLIAFGGPGSQSAIIHLSNLFPKYKATMTAIITGSFQLSFIVFYVFDSLWQAYGWSYTTIFRSYCIVCLCNLLVSAFFWPDQPLNFEDQMKVLHGDEEENSGILTGFELSPATMRRLPSTMLYFTKQEIASEKYTTSYYGSADLEQTEPTVVIDRKKIEQFYSEDHDFDSFQEIGTPLDETVSARKTPKALELISFGLAQEIAHLTQSETNCCLDEGELLEPIAQSLSQQILSWAFIRLTVFFVVCAFWTNFYVGTASLQLGDLNVVPIEEISSYSESLTLYMSSGVFAIPVIGWLMDTYGFPITMLVTVFFGITWAVLLGTENPEWLYASFMFFSLFRTFLYTFIFSYLADRLGFKFYGVLVGIMFIISGFVSLLQYWLLDFAEGDCSTSGDSVCTHSQWLLLNRLMLLMFVALLIFPYQDYTERRRIASAKSMQTFFRSNSRSLIPPEENITAPIKV